MLVLTDPFFGLSTVHVRANLDRGEVLSKILTSPRERTNHYLDFEPLATSANSIRVGISGPLVLL